MMDLNLNLLPAEKKKHLKYIANFLLTKDILKLIILISSVLSAVLVWSWVFLERDFAGLAENALAVNREFNAYNQDVKTINDLTKNINSSNQNFAPLTPKLKELINALPSDIKINSLQIDRQAQTLILNGEARTRQALLNYQDVLNKITWISQVETPASQLFQKENINFEFKAGLKNFALKGGATPSKPKPRAIED
ncbi:MAG TPA: PilN domain-containing protein [Candidatus Udaeobacter sp.]|nr:PilN domain-containing protein [Candidatus Udaeobacter sp.]